MIIIEVYSITWITTISLLIVLVLIFTLYYFVLLHDKKIIEKNSELVEQEKKFLASIINAGEMERKSISRDLHDNVGMLISTLKLKIDEEVDNLNQRQINANSLRSCDVLIDKLYNSVKNISNSLAPSPLIKFGLYEGCKFLADEINQIGIHKIKIKKLAWKEYDIKSNEQIYFIIKEIINNSIKHNKAKYSEIVFNENTQSKIITIKSDVTGITDKDINKIIENSSSNGLKNIFGRLVLVNGKICFNNDTNNKSEITITIEKM